MVKKKVTHFKRSNLAQAPDELSKSLNKFSDWESVVVTDPKDLPTDGSLVHFHNQFVPYDGPKLIQYHSEPENAGCMPPNRFDGDANLPEYRLVIAQYHATLPEYESCKIVRNVIDWTLPIYTLNPVEKFKIGYSPSTKFRINQWFDKGYDQTKKILEKSGFDFDIITDVSLEVCLRRKAVCSVIIDECVTGSYHRSGLEGLALGKLTICGFSNVLADIVCKVSGAEFYPFVCSDLDDLPDILVDCYEDTEYVRLIGIESRQWMDDNWHPEQIVSDFIGHYSNCLS